MGKGGRGREAECLRRKENIASVSWNKGGFSLKTVAIIFHSFPCGLLYHFDSSQKKKKIKEWNKITACKSFRLGEGKDQINMYFRKSFLDRQGCDKIQVTEIMESAPVT